MTGSVDEQALAIANKHGLPVAIGTPERDLVATFLLRYDREHTRTAYRQDFAAFFGLDGDGDLYVTLEQALAVTFEDVNRWIASIEGDYAPRTVRRRLSAIRTFYDWLIELGVAQTNPAGRRVTRRIPKPATGFVQVLTQAEAKKLVGAARSHEDERRAARDGTLIELLIHACLRRSEAAAADIEHVKQSGDYWRLMIPESKGGSDQWVVIPAHVARACQDLAEKEGAVSGPLFRSHSNNNWGNRLSTESIRAIVAGIGERAGLSDLISPHTLRHTGCTLALEGGASLHQVQQHARHGHVNTTMVYVHQRDKLKDSAAHHIHI